jgi:hypothetical protein
MKKVRVGHLLRSQFRILTQEGIRFFSWAASYPHRFYARARRFSLSVLEPLTRTRFMRRKREEAWTGFVFSFPRHLLVLLLWRGSELC